MDVKEAVRTARKYITNLFADEGVEYVGLEEVEFDDSASVWNVTIGFYRSWDLPKPEPLFAGIKVQKSPPSLERRSYKVVRIHDRDGQVISVMNRALAEHN